MKQCSFAIAAFLSATALTGAGLLAAPAAWAQTAPSPQTTQSASATSAVGDEAVVKLTAKIVKIDAASNSVAVKGPKGKTVVIDVDPATADVKKLKVGDEVHVAYREAVLMSADKVDPKGVRSRMTAESTSPASNGVVVKTREVQIVATIRKIDPASREVTLAGPQRTVSMTVSPDVDLSQFKVGDSILATYAAAMAIDVTRNGDVVR